MDSSRKLPPLVVPSGSLVSSNIDSPHRRARSSHTYKRSMEEAIPPSASSAQFDHIALASANPFKRRRASDVSFSSPSSSSIHRPRSRRPSLASSIKSYVSIAHPHATKVGQTTSLPEWIRPWIPLIIWGGVSLLTLILFLIFRAPIIRALEALSIALKDMGLGGIAIMWSMIFVTTFPPLSGYSTFITLSGFSFGFLEGFVISYTAALTGASLVFLLSRAFFQLQMNTLLSKSKSLKGVVRAVEKKGFKLLFLIRLAPYPYNVLNVLLASSPHLSFKTYTIATACALPKLMFHTFLGSSLSSFSQHLTGNAVTDEDPDVQEESAGVANVRIASFVLAALTGIGALVYLFIVARRAVLEVEQEEDLDEAMEQGVFESDDDLDDDDDDEKSPLAKSPLAKSPISFHSDSATYRDDMLSPDIGGHFPDMRHRRSPSPTRAHAEGQGRSAQAQGHSHDVSLS